MAVEAKSSAGSAPVRPGTRLAHGFRALKVRNYRIYWIGLLVSMIGGWMQTTAQAWLVLQLTGSPLALGIVTTLQFLPILLLSLFGGVIADRFPKQRVLLVTQSLLLLQATMFGTLTLLGHIQIWQIYLLASMQGLANAFDTPARQSFAVELVGREEVVNAVALNSMLFNTARIIGPATAGLMIAAIGFGPVILLNAASFLAMITALLLIDPKALFAVPSERGGSVRRRLLDGLSYVRRTPEVLTILIIVGSIGTFGYNFTIILPLLAEFVLKTDSAGFGALTASMGVGSLVGALMTAYTRDVNLRRVLIGAVSFSFLLAAVALSPIYALSAVLLIVLGIAGITFATTANSLVQMVVPDNLRGRVMSLYVLLFMGSTPIGGFLIGSLSSIFGVPPTLLLCASLCFTGTMVALFYQRTVQATIQADSSR